MDQSTEGVNDQQLDAVVVLDEDDGYPPDHAAMLARQWGYWVEDAS